MSNSLPQKSLLVLSHYLAFMRHTIACAHILQQSYTYLNIAAIRDGRKRFHRCEILLFVTIFVRRRRWWQWQHMPVIFFTIFHWFCRIYWVISFHCIHCRGKSIDKLFTQNRFNYPRNFRRARYVLLRLYLSFESVQRSQSDMFLFISFASPWY